MLVDKVFDAQLDGYLHGPKRLALIGPPGTGKTYSMLNGFLEQALESGVGGNDILSCSFTRAAAKELRVRLSNKLHIPEYVLLETCSTIHAESLRRFKVTFPNQKFKIMGADDEEGPSSRFMEDFVLDGVNSVEKAAALRLWDLARNSLITDYYSNEFSDLLFKFKAKHDLTNIRQIIKTYESHKKTNKLLDFTDILINALRCTPPKRKLLVVDEVQDCSLLQWTLIDKWSAVTEKVVYCGDTDQCIYLFNNARPEKVMELKDRDFEFRRLQKSYRVPQSVHKIAREIILKNINRIEAPYEPTDKPGIVYELDNSAVLATLEEREDKEIFILARSAVILDRWVDYLTNKGISFINERGRSPWAAPTALATIKAVLAIRAGNSVLAPDLLRLVENIPGRNRDYIRKGATKKGVIQALQYWKGLFVSMEDLDKLGIETQRITKELLEVVLTELQLEWRAILFSRMIEKHGPEVVDRKPSIRLTTFHGSKAREADVVIADLEVPQIVTRESFKSREALESERRLLYVAVTRSKDELILVRTPKFDYGQLVGVPNIGREPRLV